MWERIAVILRKEFIQALREPRMRLLLFVPPMVQLIVFGFAVNLDVDHTRIAWMDMDRTPLSRELRARFEGSGRFDVVVEPASERGGAADARPRRGAGGGARAAGVRARRAARASGRGAGAGGRDQFEHGVAGVGLCRADDRGVLRRDHGGAAERANAGARSRRAGERGGPAGGRARTRVWFNPDLYSRNYFVPGVVGNIIMMVTLMLTAMAIVREKEIGTMEQLMVTPIRPIELMLGKTLPFAVVGLIEVALITAAALLVFHIPFRGSAAAAVRVLGCCS